MKTFKRFTALVLALVMAAMLAVSAYAATVVVKYKVYVYTSQLTFKQYDYSSSTTPSTRNLTILADSSLGSGSALYHVKYVDGALAYCIQPGVRSDDSSNYVQGSSGCWYNLPASVQSGIALALACGYPSAEYGTAYGDSNSSDIIGAEKWAATQAVIWDLICEYRSPYDYRSWGSSPFYNCVDTSRYGWLSPDTMTIDYGTHGMPDIGANQMYYNATRKGTIDTIPEVPGLAVWKSGHIGVYIGGGQVIEAMGTKYGVVMTQLQGRGWTHWLEIPYINYD